MEADVLIIGGGPAGLSAALYLGRACKSAVVLDRGQPRHAVSAGVHNFLTRDGTPPAALRSEAWEQMAAYPAIRHVEGVDITSLEWRDERWRARAGEREFVGRAALLATGVIDEHPEIAGYAERWGRSIHHCPYCHGWELRDRPLAVLGAGEPLAHMAPLLRGWSDDVAVVTNGAPLEQSVAEALAAAGIAVHTQPITALEGEAPALSQIRFADGSALARSGLFVIADQRQVPLVASLDLELDEAGYVVVDERAQTSLPMLWAAGDLTTQFQQVVIAAAQGGLAGGHINAVLTLS